MHPESTTISAGLPTTSPLTLHGGNGIIHNKVVHGYFPQLNDMCPFFPRAFETSNVQININFLEWEGEGFPILTLEGLCITVP